MKQQPTDMVDPTKDPKLVDDFALMATVAEAPDDIVSKPFQVLQKSEADIEDIENNGGPSFLEKAAKLDAVYRQTRDELLEHERAFVTDHSRQRKAHVDRLLEKHKPTGDAAAIRAGWWAIDPAERASLYREADPVTKAAVATAPPMPKKRDAYSTPVFERLIPEQMVIDDLMEGDEFTANQVKQLDRRIQHATWATGTVLSLLEYRLQKYGLAWDRKR